MTYIEKINSLTLDECFTIIDEYQQLCDIGSIDNSLMRNIARDHHKEGVLGLSFVGIDVSIRLAKEYKAIKMSEDKQ